MNRFRITGVSVALDADGFGNEVTGASFTLTANSSGDSLAHKVTVLNNTGNNHAGKTITLVGTGPNGEPQTESLTGPGGTATVTSAKHYLTLTSATPSATIGADTFDIGWAAESVSAWTYLIDAFGHYGVGFGATVDSGSPTYSVQHTMDGGAAAYTHADVSGETTSQYGGYTSPIQAIRLIWTAAGGVTLNGLY